LRALGNGFNPGGYRLTPINSATLDMDLPALHHLNHLMHQWDATTPITDNGSRTLIRTM
jgi:hypothetical protein